MLTNLEVKHLLTFRAVVEAGTFARAADRLGYTQSAVSQQIAVLERMVGAALFDRPGGPKPPVLTAAGRLLVERGSEIERQVESLAVAFDDLAAGKSGRLRVGTFQSVSARIVPDVVALMAERAPEIHIILVEEMAESSLVEKLESGDLDVSFAVSSYPGLEQQLLLEDRYLVVTRADQAGDGPTVPLDEAVAEPLLGMSGDDVCTINLEAGLVGLGVEAKWAYRSADNGTIQSMARAGLGQALMPQLALDLSDPDVRFQELDPPLPARTVYLSRSKRRTTSAAEELFWELAVQVSSGVAAEWQTA